jgi:hypothetical protein
MNRRGSRFVLFVSRLGVAGRGGFLIAAVLVAYVFAAPVAWLISGPFGSLASGVAAGLCLVAALAALVVNFFFRSPALALHNMLSGMILRMGIPLALGMVLHSKVELLATHGMLYYMIGFYFVSLAVEIALTLPAVLPVALQARKS